MGFLAGFASVNASFGGVGLLSCLFLSCSMFCEGRERGDESRQGYVDVEGRARAAC